MWHCGNRISFRNVSAGSRNLGAKGLGSGFLFVRVLGLVLRVLDLRAPTMIVMRDLQV